MRKPPDENREAHASGQNLEQPAPDWEAYQGRKTLTLHEAVALSLNIRLDFEHSVWGEPCEGTAESAASAFGRRLSIVSGHIEDGTLRARKRIFRDWAVFVPPDVWDVDVNSFRELARTKRWALPPDFPGNEAGPPTGGTTALVARPVEKPPSSGITMTLPHTTRTLEGIFEILRKYWTNYDPENPPKQTTIAEAIDKKLGWTPKSDGTPSRGAETLAVAIRPDPLADADIRRKIRPHRGKS